MRGQHLSALLTPLMANLHPAWITSKRRTSGVCYTMQATSLLCSSNRPTLPASAFPTSRFAKNGSVGYESLFEKRKSATSAISRRSSIPSFRVTRQKPRKPFPSFSSNISLTSCLMHPFLRRSTKRFCLGYSCPNLAEYLTWWT